MQVIERGGVPIKAWVDGVPVEEGVWQQLGNLSRLPFIHRWVAAMPDCHVGIGATVGTVIATDRAIIPAAVGVDIGCVDADSEYLSPDGWRRIADYDGGKVMQYDPDTGEGSFVEPLAYVRLPCSRFFALRTKYGVNQLLSEEHRVLCWREQGRERRRIRTVMTASDLVGEHQRLKLGARVEFETTFTPVLTCSLPLSPEALRVQVMTMADGSLDGSVAVLRLKKERKILRARYLLEQARIAFTEAQYDGVTSLRFRVPVPTKTYAGFWVASLAQLAIIAEECLHWDGNLTQRCFYTRDLASADFIQYAFTAAGYRAVLAADGKLDYRVYARTNTRVGIAGTPKSEISEVASPDGLKYCFTLPSGFWVMRREGNVVMTGNCGMNAYQLNLRAEDLPEGLAGLRSRIEAAIPHGRTDNGGRNDRGAWGDLPREHREAWATLARGWDDIRRDHPKIDRGQTEAHLGTLGSGNHFVEVCLDTEGGVWVLLHSGSRGVGNRIGTYFIEQARREMERWHVRLPDRDLAYLPEGTGLFDDYVSAVGWAQEFARENRALMGRAVLGAIRAELPNREVRVEGHTVSCHHNYVEREHHYGKNVLVTRKGAVRAREGDLGIIPGSMGARSFIVRGRGNPESFHSCSHGAGRLMSRAEAKRRFTLADHEAAVAGVECRRDEGVLDETPGAYKPIEAVMAAQADLVEVLFELRQVLCVKG